ncbi:glycosyltransferase involved in cell wall biosynthesis [Neolewinella xylanilytica]|uniref:Glycosyltransferase involved in cell wall biosynthesis n=1 Tax=Neolewinella xylanilytica TaxID=1514080 RepID=A0A2S6I5G9_9BACT|nr:glycosyltransferase family 4 protein [Neolewinella xylanilytica]PPK86417.1 glycosyltransferase involved in cell wall biosynthesis [Neolewinella xylanilytica]
MRIVCLVTNDLSHDQRMDRICSSLQAAGHAVTLVGRWLPESPPLPEKTYRQHRVRCRYNVGKRFYGEINWRLWRTVRNWDYDVICAVDLDSLLAGTLLHRPGTKLVYDAHEWFSETPEVAPRPLIRGTWRGLGRALVPRTDARYTVGPELAKMLETDYGVAFDTVRNVPRRGQYLNKENTGGVILYQGMLNPGRGLEVAIGAMQFLPDHALWIVGSGPERARLEELAAGMGIVDRVRFVGFQPPEKLPEFTLQAWLGINLLRADSQSYYYSLANKSLDYIQAHLPSIQMDYPEYRALHDRYQCFSLLPELSAPALAAQIRALAENPEAYRQLQTNCRLAAEELCWEREEAKLLAIYAGLTVD